MTSKLFSVFLLVATGAARAEEFALEVASFRVLERDLGPDSAPGTSSYYRVVSENGRSFLHAAYQPSAETVTLFRGLPDHLGHGVHTLRFRWRALTLPSGGNECIPERGDAAATVYVTWKRGMRWFSLKLIWSSEAPLGATCNKVRNPFVASDTIVLRSGGPVGEWREESVDIEHLFREHFANGDPRAEIPELQGLGLLTDGDQTNSPSAADYADFVLLK